MSSSPIIRIVLVVLIVVLLGVFIFLGFRYRELLPGVTRVGNANVSATTNTSPANRNVNLPQSNVNAGTNLNAPPASNVNAGGSLDQTRAELERLARNFANVYGSYSNQTNFANLEDLFPFMTASYQNQVKTYIASERAKKRDTSQYFGVTTRAVAITVDPLDLATGTAKAAISCQRQETSGANASVRTFQQDLLLDFKKESGVWKVDGAGWR